MATPTPGKPSAVAATPPVSTPFSQSHLTAFSPRAPRGSVVPSPQQVRKSPANSNTLYGHPTNSSFGAMNFDSPSAAAALGLGDMSLAMPLATMKAEDDQKAKLGQILDILKVSKGRVTEEGLERLGRRLGLTFMWENTPNMPPGSRSLVFAGSLLMLEVLFTNGVVNKVSLELLESSEGSSYIKYSDKAAKILLKDLEWAPGDSALTKMLDAFAENMERLANLDRLSVAPTLNCYMAIIGIYESLKRLHDWEFARLREGDATTNEDLLARMVMCTKSGRPVMHARSRVGLSMEYWQEKRLCSKVSGASPPKIWAMVLECTNAPDASFAPEELYTRVRVSDAWISPSIQKSDPSPEDLMSTAVHNTLLDWLEPDLTLVPTTEASKADAVMQGVPIEAVSQSKLPDIMFVANFEPPVAIPNYIADWIYHVIHATRSLYPEIRQVTLDALLIPYGAGESNLMDPTRQVKRQRSVPVKEKTGAMITKLHENTLFIPKLDPGYELRELPFSHPRQLVEILPFLRQYAFLATLMEKSFGTKTEKVTIPAPAASPGAKVKKQSNKRDDFMEFMQSGENSQSNKDLKIDVSLVTESGGTMQPPFRAPLIALQFPFSNRTANISFEIGLNGAVTIVHENVLPQNEDIEMIDGADGKRSLTKEDLGGILEACEDVNIFAEYVRKRLG